MTTVGFIGTTDRQCPSRGSPSRPGNRWLLSKLARSRNARGQGRGTGAAGVCGDEREAARSETWALVTVPVQGLP